MKTLTLIITLALLSACSTSRVQSTNDAHETMINSLDKVNFSKSFCNGKSLRFYYEGSYAYSITCLDGRHFTIKK